MDLNADERFAKEMQDRELAYKLQIEADHELAQSLSENNSRDDVQITQVVSGRPQHSNSQIEADHELAQSLSENNSRDDVQITQIVSGRPQHSNTQCPVHSHIHPHDGYSTEYETESTASDSTFSTASDSTLTIADDESDYEVLSDLAETLGEVRERGLQGKAIDQLPVTTYRGRSGDGASNISEEDVECKVCLEEFSEGDKLRILPCLHKFHQNCIDKWIKTNATCPVCKMNVKEELRNPSRR